MAKTNWLRPAVARRLDPRQLGRRQRSIHSKSADRSSAEAIPVAHSAHYENAPKPSAIEEIAMRRIKAGKLVAGVAAASNGDMFKGDVSDPWL